MNESRSSVGSTREGDVGLQLASSSSFEVQGREVGPAIRQPSTQERSLTVKQHAEGRLVDLDPGRATGELERP